MNDMGDGDTSDLADGIRWAADPSGGAAHIINLSVGSSSSNDAVKDPIEYAHDQGVVIIAAAGNNNGGPVMFPARLPQVIAVGATNKNNRRASYSSFGEQLDIMAPGGDGLAGVWTTSWDG